MRIQQCPNCKGFDTVLDERYETLELCTECTAIEIDKLVKIDPFVLPIAPPSKLKKYELGKDNGFKSLESENIT